MVKEINAEEYSEIVKSSNPVVIDFHATWCGPCKVLSPILEELDDEIEGVEFVKLDVDQHPQIAGQNQVMGVPTVVILKDGEVCCKKLHLDFDEVYQRTNTSYKPTAEGLSDYKSASSVERIEAFLKLGKKDPVEYVDGWETAKEHVTALLASHE